MNSDGLKEGALIGGRYCLEREIGAGGMGKVFQAMDKRLNRAVAVKVQLDPSRTRKDADERFLREARIGAQLSHPNLVQTYDFGTEEGFRYLVIELLDGEDLFDCLRLRGFLPVAMAADIAMQVASGMAEAHAKGLVHRDLKPENIFLIHGARPLVKVLDFGMAVDIDATSPMGRITMEGAIGGTPRYMAPETLKGEPTGAPADVYALGCVIYEMLTGSTPFASEMLSVLTAHHLYASVPPLEEHRKNIPPLLQELTLRCLSKRPAARPSMVQVNQRLIAEKEEQKRAQLRGQDPDPRTSLPSFEEAASDERGELQRVAVRGGVASTIEITLRAAGFDVVSEKKLAAGDALICLGLPGEDIEDLRGCALLLLADADPGDTDRVTQLLRLGIDEVVARPVKGEELVRKLRRAFRKQSRASKAMQ